ncbi:MAG: hypothetical protein ABFD54_05970 [Armatimonadota bacterium]
MLSVIKNILTAFGTISGLLTMIPYITTLIEQMESTSATGEQKKSAVLDLVSQVLTTVDKNTSIDLPTDAIIECISGLVDIIVKIKNLVGAFEHSTETTSTDDVAVTDTATVDSAAA